MTFFGFKLSLMLRLCPAFPQNTNGFRAGPVFGRTLQSHEQMEDGFVVLTNSPAIMRSAASFNVFIWSSSLATGDIRFTSAHSALSSQRRNDL
uniref:Secreted protein n=1 Tax=Angiostrongylus cantonensis TaxID=6313 RepID=A0A0K0DIM4_ANGCA